MGIFKNAMLFCVAEIKYLACRIRFKHRPYQAINKVADIADAAGNAAISIDGQRLIV